MRKTLSLILFALSAISNAQTVKYYRNAYEDCAGEIRGSVEAKDINVGGVYRFTLKNGMPCKIEFLKNGKPQFGDKNDAMRYYSVVEIKRSSDCIAVNKKGEYGNSYAEYDLDKRGFKKNEFTESGGEIILQDKKQVDMSGKIISSSNDEQHNIYRYDESCNMVERDLFCYCEFKKDTGQISYVHTDSLRLCTAFKYAYDSQHNKVAEYKYDEGRNLKSVVTYAYDSRSNLTEWIYSYDEEYPDPTMNNPERVVVVYDSLDQILEQRVYDSENQLAYAEAIQGFAKTYYDANRDVIARLGYDSTGTLVEMYHNLRICKGYYIWFIPRHMDGVSTTKYIYGSIGDAKRLHQEIYLDESGNPAETDSCVSKVFYKYDDNRVIKSSCFYDIHGNLIKEEIWDRKKSITIGNVLFTE